MVYLTGQRTTLEQLLHTTAALVAEVGCRNTTLQEIIKRSGLSKGAIYHYVQGKDELFGLILQGHMEMKVGQHHSMTFNHPLFKTPLAPLSIIVKGLLQPANDRQIVLRRCFIYLLSRQEQEDVAKILDELHQSWIGFVFEWLTICQNAGAISANIDIRKTSAMFISTIFGLMVQKTITENRIEEDEHALDVQTVLQMFGRILGYSDEGQASPGHNAEAHP
jgi:AcrR family transcriptional regulator